MLDPVSTAYGITISFASGFLAEIIGVTLPSWLRAAIDVSHAQSPDKAMQFIPAALADYGELGVDLNFDSAAVPPIDQDPEAVTVTFPSGTTWAFTGFLTEYGGEAPIDDRMTASATIKAAGKITITPAA